MKTDTQKLEGWGLRATWVYLIILFGGIPIAAYFGAIELTSLTLNELGDFFAGAFGPLAIFWLVLGFFQQGRELQNSVKTLELQAKELANSVEQQRELVSVTRETLNHERQVLGLQESKRKQSLQPIFEVEFRAVSGQEKTRFKFELNITNVGGTVSRFDAHLYVNKEHFLARKSTYFKNGETLKAQHNEQVPPPKEGIELVVHFSDQESDAFEIIYELRPVTGVDEWPTYLAEIVRESSIGGSQQE